MARTLYNQKSMKNVSLALVFFFSAFTFSFGQQLDLPEWNAQSLDKQQKGMLVLASWAVGNIVWGSIAARNAGGSTRYFHQMNAAWNTVNLGIAVLGYYQAQQTDPATWSLAESIRQNYKLEKILLFNTGLDLAYMAGGAWMIEKGKTAVENQERWKGFGKSLILQGAFLLVFDIASFAIHAADNSQLENLTGKLQFGGNTAHLLLNF